MSDPNWAEQVTALATAVGSIGLLSTLGLAIFAGRQVQEAQHARHAQLAADFLRRWDEPELVETRRLVAELLEEVQLAEQHVRRHRVRREEVVERRRRGRASA
jgi:hypothetical protein